MISLKSGILSVGVAIASFAFASTASAVTYGFDGLTNNSSTDTAIGEAQLFVDVTQVVPATTPETVSFLFYNIGPEASSITQIYWEAGDPNILANIESITSGTGTSFAESTGNLGLPGAGGNGPNSVLLEAFGTDADSPVQPNGVNPGEQVEVIFSLTGGATFDDLIAQIDAGDIMFGFHVQGFASGGSESFLNGGECIPGTGPFDPNGPNCNNTGPQIPLPAGLPLMLSVIGIGAYMRKQSRKTA